jgi:hypothetical protein
LPLLNIVTTHQTVVSLDTKEVVDRVDTAVARVATAARADTVVATVVRLADTVARDTRRVDTVVLRVGES